MVPVMLEDSSGSVKMSIHGGAPLAQCLISNTVTMTPIELETPFTVSVRPSCYAVVIIMSL